MPARSGEFGQLIIGFTNTTIEHCKIQLDESFGVLLGIWHCTLQDFITMVKVSSLSMDVMESYFNATLLTLSASAVFVSLHSVEIGNSQFEPVHIQGNKLYLVCNHSSIHHSAGGFVLTKDDSGLLESWIEAHIERTVFSNNTKFGSGPAVFLKFISSTGSQSLQNTIVFAKCHFEQNYAKSASGSTRGGAVSVLFFGSAESSCSVLVVNVSQSKFIDNDAEDGGGSLYTSTGCVHLFLKDCYFEINQMLPKASKGLLLLSHSNVQMENCSYSTRFAKEMSSILELQMLNEQTAIRRVDAVLTCPRWFFLDKSEQWKQDHSTGEIILSDLILHCSSCAESYYYALSSQFKLSYNSCSKENVSNRTSILSGNSNCLKCPWGASCPGNNLTPKPNFWGQFEGDKVKFYQCPLGYCCAGNTESPCQALDSCYSDRDKQLCGSCLANYSLSILSAKCIQNIHCNDGWIWPLAVLCVVLYMLWYTFKDTIIQTTQSLVLHSLNILSHKAEQTDAGYFGILIYFIQTEALIQISISKYSLHVADKMLQRVNFYIKIFLTFEVSSISMNLCPLQNMTLLKKVQIKFLFLMGIYFSWAIFHALSFLGKTLLSKGRCFSREGCSVSKYYTRGFVEIIKYTYSGLSDVMFFSLTCVQIGDRYVWYYSGSVQCFNNWQIGMLVFGILYILPFPFALFLGLKLLRSKHIRTGRFLVGLCIPGLVLVHWLNIFYNSSNTKQIWAQGIPMSQERDKGNLDAFELFRGGYRMSNSGTEYWESIILLRRLFICSTVVISNSVLRLVLCSVLNAAFFGHHLWVKPFVHRPSNCAEGLSLFLLTITSTINLFKAMQIHGGMSLDGEDSSMVQIFGVMENMFLPLLVIFIVLKEVHFRQKE